MSEETMTTEQTVPEVSIGGEGAECQSGTPQAVEQEYEHASFAVLLALVPLLVFTLFGQMGLF
jgi:hypothetical protein